MSSFNSLPQFFTRMALGIGFLLPVADRLGYMGPPGSADAAWGNWDHFITYTHSLMPFTNRSAAQPAGVLVTIMEVILGLCLIAGFKTKWMGLGAAALTFTFGLFMIFSLGIAAPFKYPVFVFTGAGLLLYTCNSFSWSIDARLHKKASAK